MARKKPEAVQVLERITRPKCAECEAVAIIRDGPDELCEAHYVAKAQREAERNMPDELMPQPGESPEQLRTRRLKWLRESVKKVAEDKAA
jgi:hypothetical protein